MTKLTKDISLPNIGSGEPNSLNGDIADVRQETDFVISLGSSKKTEAPDWEEANIFLRQQVGDKIFCGLRIQHRCLSMHDALILAERLKAANPKKNG